MTLPCDMILLIISKAGQPASLKLAQSVELYISRAISAVETAKQDFEIGLREMELLIQN